MDNIHILILWFVGNIFQFYILITMFVYLFISFSGIFFYKRNDKKFSHSKKFAVLIPAHNEEKVIGNLLESLSFLDYPKDLYDVYVICDHCSDSTSKISKGYNVNILSYDDNLPSNKARALNRATKDILSSADKYDAFCYIDADSLIHPDFLKAMSGCMDDGGKAIQGMQLPKNRNESILSMIVSSGQFITNNFFQKPKEFLGLSATLHGKGMCFSTEIVKKFKWDESCLTEDLEMQMRLINAGIRIRWCESAIVYDEEPVHITQYIKRSVRWTRGSLDTAKKHAWRLLVSFIKTSDFKILEGFIYCFGVYRIIVVFISLVSIYFTKDKFNILVYFFHLIPYDDLYYKLIFISLPFIIFPLSMIFDKRAGFPMFSVYFLQPALGFLRFPIFVLGILKDRKIWDRTDHTSTVRIGDLLKIKT
ncbi:MAG TPA: glycosyltransferase family 2 protein [Elusimicrobiales bacterium]|nr:glycosyltransferase family 2 protein [Elusimicrobiales bacterium]HOL62117.1 glycosyltransferase family 2 protein [Elusimicrobiales bacterium]HPO94704.1 glycosyltransferase family 2 protein [Elusimicrobiales bacterium]